MVKIKAIAASALAVAIGAATASSAKAADESLTYGIASYSFTYAPLYIAEDAGIFKKHGLDIKGEMMSGSGVEASATIAGNLPFYVGLPETAALAIAKGQKLDTFAEISQQFPMDIVVSKKVAQEKHLTDAMPIEKRLEALKGLRIADWTPGGAADMLISFIIGKLGWSPHDLTLLPIGPATAMIAALQNDRIDGFIWSSPSSDEAVRRLGAFKVYTGALGEWAPLNKEVFNCLNGNPQWLAAHKADAVKIWRSLDEAMAFMRAHKAQTKSLLRKRLKMFSDADFEAGYKNLYHMIPDSPEVGPAQAKKIEVFMKASNPSFNVPADELVYPAIGQEAMKQGAQKSN